MTETHERVEFPKMLRPCPECLWFDNPKHAHNDRAYVRGKRVRAGVFFYDRVNDKVLIVQTYGKFCGIPKGGQEKDETLKQTALRELKEETGVVIPEDMLTTKVTLNRSAHYFIIESEDCPSEKYNPVLYDFVGNDVTGTGWIHPRCIKNIPGSITSHLSKMLSRLGGEVSKNKEFFDLIRAKSKRI